MFEINNQFFHKHLFCTNETHFFVTLQKLYMNILNLIYLFYSWFYIISIIVKRSIFLSIFYFMHLLDYSYSRLNRCSISDLSFKFYFSYNTFFYYCSDVDHKKNSTKRKLNIMNKLKTFEITG